MSDTALKIYWVDSSCPFDDSETGLTYAKTIDSLVDDLVDSLFADENLSFGFETSEFSDEDVRYFAIYDDSGSEIISSRNGVDPLLFKRNIIDKYANPYPLIHELFRYRSYLSESFPGFTWQPLDKNHPEYAIDRAFYGELDKGRTLNDIVIRYVFQKIMYHVVNRHEDYTIVNPWERDLR